MTDNKNVSNPVESQIDENMLDSFATEEEIDPNEEKIKEMNSRLPKWSLEPPKGFLK